MQIAYCHADVLGPLAMTFRALLLMLLFLGRSIPMLCEQYRMHPSICNFVSKSFYNGRLVTPRESGQPHLLACNLAFASDDCRADNRDR